MNVKPILLALAIPAMASADPGFVNETKILSDKPIARCFDSPDGLTHFSLTFGAPIFDNFGTANRQVMGVYWKDGERPVPVNGSLSFVWTKRSSLIRLTDVGVIEVSTSDIGADDGVRPVRCSDLQPPDQWD